MIKAEIGKFQDIGHNVSPKLYCDVCGKEVYKEEFTVFFPEGLKEGDTVGCMIAHKKRCAVIMDKEKPDFPWMEGSVFMYHLLLNIFGRKGNWEINEFFIGNNDKHNRIEFIDEGIGI